MEQWQSGLWLFQDFYFSLNTTVQTSLSHLNIWRLPQWDDVLFKPHEIWHKNESAAIFYTTMPQQSFMTCPLMEFCHRSDVTQNPPQSPSNHVKDRTPFLHRCSLSTAFPPKDDGEGFGVDSIQFLHWSCAEIKKKKLKGSKKSDQRTTKSFPP